MMALRMIACWAVRAAPVASSSTCNCPSKLRVYSGDREPPTGPGTEFSSAHAAAAAAAACAPGPGCATTTITLERGVHTLGGRPLRVGSRQSWCGRAGAMLSAGAAVTGWSMDSAGLWSAPLPAGAAAGAPKSLRVGQQRAEQATFPSVHHIPRKRWLFARHVEKAAANTTAERELSVDADKLPRGWQRWDNRSLVVYCFPGNSWVGLRLCARPNPRLKPDGEARFTISVPDGTSGLETGNRVSFAGAPALLNASGSSGVWAYDSVAKRLLIRSAAAPEDVWVPSHAHVMEIDGKSDVNVSGITFVDTDFTASGVQNGFNVDAGSAGCPHDAAVAVSRSQRVRVSGCQFIGVAGGGVLIGNSSTLITVRGSNFSQMGQSGVMFVGNDSTQPRNCSVTGNRMRGIGTILASAGGVLVTSASQIYIGQNNISDCGRWGIAIRSNRAASSADNTVEGNRISNTGLTSADFGAISLIDHTGNAARGLPGVGGNVIRGNCVKSTRGMRDQQFRGSFGKLLTSFWGRAVYLDDYTSNVLIERNVFVDSSHAVIFFHSGSNNTVLNNVFVNSTLCGSSSPSTQLLFKDITHGCPCPKMRGNVLRRNVVWTPRKAEETPGLTVKLLGGTVHGKESVESGENVFYRPGKPIIGTEQLFWAEDWRQWRASGKTGNGSLLNEEPGFADADGGDFALLPTSPLHALGFEPLPMPKC